MTGEPRPPARVRVTASRGRHAPATRGIALPGSSADEADTVFSRGLARAQLRLALGSVLAFLVVSGALAAMLFVLPAVWDPVVLGVPLSWLLHAYGFYPVILVFAIAYAAAASRNERRYRALAGGDDGGDGAQP